jgi:predicted amidohydrolase
MTEVKVSTVQYSYKPINNFEDFEENVEELIEKAYGSDFIIFPEAFTLEFQYLISKNDISRLHEFTVD